MTVQMIIKKYVESIQTHCKGLSYHYLIICLNLKYFIEEKRNFFSQLCICNIFTNEVLDPIWCLWYSLLKILTVFKNRTKKTYCTNNYLYNEDFSLLNCILWYRLKKLLKEHFTCILPQVKYATLLNVVSIHLLKSIVVVITNSTI